MSSGLQVSDRNGVSRMYDKILGCLLGAATGDAMGAATEAKSTGQIKEIFGGRVESFQKPPRDVQARGRKPGQVTDAFSIPYMLTNAIMQADGKITRSQWNPCWSGEIPSILNHLRA